MLIAIAAALTGCSTYSPDARHEVVLIEKPYFFDTVVSIRILSRLGASILVVTEGEDVYMQPQNMKWNLRYDDV
jgi:hypothetical protein